MKTLAAVAALVALCTVACGPATVRLAHDPDLCFATVFGDGGVYAGVLGDGWALELSFPSGAFPFYEAARPLTRTLAPSSARLIRGPDLPRYVHVPAGPPTPPVPETGGYEVLDVEGLTVTFTSRDEERRIDVGFSSFRAGGTLHEIPGLGALPILGPNP